MNINNNGDRTGAILELGRAIGDFVEDMERSEAEAVIALIAKIAHVEWTGRHVYSRQSATYARYERDEAVRQTREVEDTALAEAVRHVREVEDAARVGGCEKVHDDRPGVLPGTHSACSLA